MGAVPYQRLGLKSGVHGAEGNERRGSHEKYAIFGLIVLTILIGPMAATAAYTIDDSGANAYWGGISWDGSGSTRDVIGRGYAVDGINVIFTGNTMTVEVIGPYFSSTGAGSSQWSQSNAYGDLCISSTGWHVSTNDSPNYPTDTFKTDGSEGWNYVVGPKWNQTQTSTTPGVYNLDFSIPTGSPNAFQFTETQLGVQAAGRALQGWKGGHGNTFFETATITPDTNDSMLIYTFDDTFLAGKTLGLHWTMICGNDVVEGQVTVPPQVPEPATIVLIGFGLAGLGLYRRRAVRK
jgi:hypothetical protein